MKKAFRLGIILILVFCSLALSLPCSAEMAGDINNDGKISSSDYFLVKKHIYGIRKLSAVQEKNADVDNNGKIEKADIEKLLITAGKIETEQFSDSSATIYQLSTSDDALMMSYLIVTENGNLIMIDGGMTGTSNLYNSLYNQLKRFGKLKDRDNVVDAWIFTHPHNDHVKAFCYVWNMHPELKVENFYFNFPTEQEILAMPEEEHVYTEDLKFFVNTFNTNMGSETAYNEYPRTEAGDSFLIDGVKFDILQTYDSAGSTYQNVDDCSMVIRMTAGGQTVLFLGDLREDAGRDLLAEYGNELKSDVVQMSRHGQNGVEKDVYEAIKPQICLWPTPLWVWNTNESTREIKGWMQDLGVKYHNTMREGWMDENYKSLNLSDNSLAIPCEYVVK